MAFEIKTFKTRALTAFIFAITMLAGLLWNKWSFIILFTIIHFGCWHEFIKLMKKIYPLNYRAKTWWGLLYISLPIILIILLRIDNTKAVDDYFMKVLPSVIVFSIWINDTMAYIVGSLIGKHPLSKISPKKTWEGTIGGAILCLVVIASAGNAFGCYSLGDWITIPLCCAIFGSFGDLLESKLKRMASVKDSGSLMPGHGGFLDRFDSLLVAIPFVFLYYLLFMR